MTPPVWYDIQALLNPAPLPQAPGPGCGTMAYALNNQGEIAGSARLPDAPSIADVGAIWSVTAPTPSYTMALETNGSALVALNDEGDAVGRLGSDRPVLVHHGQVIDLTQAFSWVTTDPDPKYPFPRVTGINNAGLICGIPPSWDNGPVPWTGYLYNWKTNTRTPIPVVPGYTYALPLAINQASDTVGLTWGSNVEDSPHVFVARGSAVHDLGYGVAGNLNDSQQACGGVAEPFGDPTPGIWDLSQTPPTFAAVPLPPGYTYGGASGMNNYGDVVGSCGPSAEPYGVPFVYLHDFSRSWDLRQLIPNGSGWSQMEVLAINDAGDIIGRGFHNGCFVAFRLQQRVNAGPPPNLDALPEVVLKIFGGVASDGPGWVTLPDGRRIYIGPRPGPWSGSEAEILAGSAVGTRWAELSPEKRDILLGLALDELAARIADPSARDALRRTSLDLAARQADRLLQTLQGQLQGQLAPSQARLQSAADAAAASSSLRRLGKLDIMAPDLMQRLQPGRRPS